MEVKFTTLFINKSESRCGFCNRGCDPNEDSHITLLGWHAYNDNMEGCGAYYTAVSTDYIGLPGLVEEIKRMRPDLPYIGWEEI